MILNDRTGENKGIWVVVEKGATKETPRRVTYEILSRARALADQLEEKVTAVYLCNHADEKSFRDFEDVGCDCLIIAENPLLENYNSELFPKIIADLAEKEKPAVILIAGTETGRDFAPAVSARLEVGLTADCTGLEINEQRELVQIRPTYGGNLMAYITTPKHRPQMATIRPNIFSVRKCESKRELEIRRLSVSADEMMLRVKRLKTEPKEHRFKDVSEAEVVLIGGYGLGKEGFEDLCALALKIDAAVGATRKVVDEGWAPYEIQVGQTGKVIAPKLCVLFGVSGALQHTIGLKNAEKIIAVNRDPSAPIFGLSTQAILGDASEILKSILKSMDTIRKGDF